MCLHKIKGFLFKLFAVTYTGFALKGWNKCEVANAAIFIAGNSATTMGKVNFTGKDGKVTTVDKTWSFIKDDAGKLRIVVHHSSLEFAGS